MQKLIKNQEILDDPWQILSNEDAENFDLTRLQNGYWLLPLKTYLAVAEKQGLDSEKIGVYLKSDEQVNDIASALDTLKVIALNFNVFADGRSFSQARMLREHFDYTGEVRAIGAFIRDQLTYLTRCGFNAFSVSDSENLESITDSLNDFTEFYQAACDEPNPLFRRRV